MSTVRGLGLVVKCLHEDLSSDPLYSRTEFGAAYALISALRQRHEGSWNLPAN